MADNNDKKNRSDEIRIVESEAEEVVRLEAPKLEPVARRSPMAEDQAMPQMMGDSDVDEVPVVLDPEDKWLSEAEKVETKNVPIGWFVVLIGGIVAATLWMIFQKPAENDAEAAVPGLKKTNASTAASSNDVPLGKEEDMQADEDAELDYDAMQAVVKGFGEATTIEERLRFVRHPERVAPLMKDYYSREEFDRFEYASSNEYHIVALENRPFVGLRVEDKDGETYPLLLEDLPGGMRVDWESFVGYQPITFEEYIEKRSTEAIELRVYATLDNFFTYEFADEQKYRSILLNSRHSEVCLYGYVEKGTVLEREILKIMTISRGKKIKQPLILKMRYLEGGKAPRSVLIEELVSKVWAYPNNPDQKTP